MRFELSLTLIPPPPPYYISNGPYGQLLAVSWLVDCLEYVYQVVSEMI